MVMDPSRKNYPLGSKAALLTVAFIFLLLTFLSLKSVSAVSGDGKSFSQMKKRLGSRPPTCINKCSNCRPCTATLVISHDAQKGRSRSAPKSYHDLEDDESYYLQAWKCKCGNKLFEP